MNSKLTGRRRHRAGWGGALVLQVEETKSEPFNCGSFIDIERVTRWRDARIEDIAADVVRESGE